MARRRRKPPTAAHDVDPRGLRAMLGRYLLWMRVTAYSDDTVDGRQQFLGRFIAWCEERSVHRPTEVTKPMLESYQRHLYHHRKENGQPLSFASQYAHLVPVRTFFKWLSKNNHILFNPASELELPRLKQRLPKHVLSVGEAERVFAQTDVRDLLGVRDRAILETFYSTGMRRMELIALKLYDIDAGRGVVMVRLGKGRKDRMIPIGARALAWIDRYLSESRPSLVVRTDDPTLFLTNQGEPFTPDYLTYLVARYVEAAELGKHGACHLFRHTMATLMLENGADIRFIQQMLGHENLSTTQVYTQVSIRALKQVHTATHPARLQRDEGPSNTEESEQRDGAEELFSSLAAEADEEET
jgi:integrase/recombinase XerD